MPERLHGKPRFLYAWPALLAAVFGIAALMHAGIILPGHQHAQARTAESVIALVLLAGAITSWLWPRHAAKAALGSQGFALLGTVVGAVMIAIGVGPRTAVDLALHAVMLIMLAIGLSVSWQVRRER